MSSLDTAHQNFSITPEDKFQDQWTLIKSTINKISLGRRNWKISSINKINQLKLTSLNTPLAPLQRPFIKLRGKKIRMYGLDKAHINFSITPEDKFKDKWTLIRSMQTNRSTINDTKITPKTPKNSDWIIIYQMNNNNLYWLNYSSRDNEWSKIK